MGKLLPAGVLALCCTSAVFAQVPPDREDHASRLCAMLVRQAVVSPASFREITTRVRPKEAAGFFDVVLRFDSANNFNAIIRADAICRFNAKDELPYFVDLAGKSLGLRQVEALWQLAVDEARAKAAH